MPEAIKSIHTTSGWNATVHPGGKVGSDMKLTGINIEKFERNPLKILQISFVDVAHINFYLKEVWILFKQLHQ